MGLIHTLLMCVSRLLLGFSFCGTILLSDISLLLMGTRMQVEASIYQPTHSSIYPSTHPSIHPLIYQPTHSSISSGCSEALRLLEDSLKYYPTSAIFLYFRGKVHYLEVSSGMSLHIVMEHTSHDTLLCMPLMTLSCARLS